MNNRPDYAREIRFAVTDARAVCEALGLLAGRGSWVRQANGVIIRCPWHEDGTPSCSVRRGPDGSIQVRCHGCGVGGDIFSLVAQVRGLSTKTDFRAVLIEAAELGGLHQIVSELESGHVADAVSRAVPVAPTHPQEQERVHMPTEECERFWSRLRLVSKEPQVVAWLGSRGLDVDAVESGDCARALPVDAKCPRWARYQGNDWTTTGHRLIFPMFDAKGEMRGVRAGRVVDGDSPKRLPPGGFKASGLVLADELGVAMLRGTYAAKRVVITEGEPDTLTWMIHRKMFPTAVIGIVSGSWTARLAQRLTTGAEVVLLTHADAAGDRYAREIVESVGHRCFFRRRPN